MSAEAQRGSEIFFFKGRCAVCHAGFNFSDGRFYNLGVGWNSNTGSFLDEGRAAISPELAPEEIDALVAFLRALNGEGYHDQPPRHFPQ